MVKYLEVIKRRALKKRVIAYENKGLARRHLFGSPRLLFHCPNPETDNYSAVQTPAP
jgi:hypothetical protein